MNPSLTLTLDFGLVGYQDDRQPFRVRLDGEALDELIADARNAWRVYELTLIQRPGDVWEYVRVTPETVPKALAGRIELARSRVKPLLGRLHRWPEGKLPFRVFDGCFHEAGEDTEPDAEAWLSVRDGVSLDAFAENLLATVQTALANLDWNDPLLQHELKLARLHKHWCSHRSRASAVESVRDYRHAPRPPEHEAGYYRQLAQLLRDPTLVSAAYRGHGDWQLFRALSAEQRRRANATGHTQLHALHLSALCDYRAGVDAWDARVWFFEEGLDHGDLFIEGSKQGGLAIKELIEKWNHHPQVVLTDQADFEIDGYQREAGDGWVVFRCVEPTTRRRNLELIHASRGADPGPVIEFEGTGSSVFPFEHGLLVLGRRLSTGALAAAATLIDNWRARGGDPLVIAEGESSTLLDAGIVGAISIPAAVVEAPDRKQSWWMSDLLAVRQPWTDVAIFLAPPLWLAQAVHTALDRCNEPWRPWVVATDALAALGPDLLLAADPAAQLREALEPKAGIRKRIRV